MFFVNYQGTGFLSLNFVAMVPGYPNSSTTFTISALYKNTFIF